MNYSDLTKEQQLLIDKTGSGKTTAIQVLCNEINDKKIVYLTYNRLLKLDAKEKIKASNVIVQNYHGFAYLLLKAINVRTGRSDLIQTFNRLKPKCFDIDLLVIDEYQDIEQEIAEMLSILKEQNPHMQIIAVGDMEQKIYDKTKLDVSSFIDDYLGEYSLLQFTSCFRLNASHAEKLGRIWGKKIKGVNENCIVEKMTMSQAINYLKEIDPSDLLCLGPRTGAMPFVLNILENDCPEKYNKSTCYASIRAEDQGNIVPDKNTAIFTTFDSSKGLERKICVIFGYDEAYWHVRLGTPDAKYEIIRNIFLVAASRGKERIIFVCDKKKETLSEKSLSTRRDKIADYTKPFRMSEMFDFKYKEDIEDCYKLLNVKKKRKKDTSRIYIKSNDELIDLAPCIGIYQEAHYFKKFNIDDQIQFVREVDDNKVAVNVKDDFTLDEKILAFTAYETKLNRYATQVKPPFVTEEQAEEIDKRLSSQFSRNDDVEVDCGFTLEYKEKSSVNNLYIFGRADVLKKDVIYELKFTSDLEHTHFLQLACYLAAMHKEKGVLWNIQTNEAYEVSVPNREKFLNAVVKTITKGRVTKAKEVNYVTREEWARKKNKLHTGSNT